MNKTRFRWWQVCQIAWFGRHPPATGWANCRSTGPFPIWEWRSLIQRGSNSGTISRGRHRTSAGLRTEYLEPPTRHWILSWGHVGRGSSWWRARTCTPWPDRDAVTWSCRWRPRPSSPSSGAHYVAAGRCGRTRQVEHERHWTVWWAAPPCQQACCVNYVQLGCW